MKKTLCVLLSIILCVSLAGCSLGKTTLNEDNYKSYLDVKAGVTTKYESQFKVYMGTFAGMPYSDSYEEYKAIQLNVNVEGLSKNHIYNEVKVNIHYYGELPLNEIDTIAQYSGTNIIRPYTFKESDKKLSIDETITINCDTSGNAIYNDELPIVIETPENTFVSPELLDGITVDITFEGSVKEA